MIVSAVVCIGIRVIIEISVYTSRSVFDFESPFILRTMIKSENRKLLVAMTRLTIQLPPCRQIPHQKEVADVVANDPRPPKPRIQP